MKAIDGFLVLISWVSCLGQLGKKVFDDFLFVLWGLN